MFKSLKYKSSIYYKKTYTILYVFELIDTDFACDIDIAVSAIDGTESNSIAAGAIVQEYAARKLNVSKNLAQWYVHQMADYKERVLYLMDKDKKYIERYFPALKYKTFYQDTVTILEKKIKELNAPTI